MSEQDMHGADYHASSMHEMSSPVEQDDEFKGSCIPVPVEHGMETLHQVEGKEQTGDILQQSHGHCNRDIFFFFDKK